jgi:hypothetical protein
VLFITTNAQALAVDESAFAPLETSLMEAKPWEPIVAEAIERALQEAPVDLRIVPIGAFPLGAVELPAGLPGPPQGAPQLGPGTPPNATK